jgi:hypothetical protein
MFHPLDGHDGKPQLDRRTADRREPALFGQQLRSFEGEKFHLHADPTRTGESRHPTGGGDDPVAWDE